MELVKVYGSDRVVGFAIILLYLSPEEVTQRRVTRSRIIMNDETDEMWRVLPRHFSGGTEGNDVYLSHRNSNPVTLDCQQMGI
jgi:hypothetical protein